MALPQINQEQYIYFLDQLMATDDALCVVGKPGIGKTRTVLTYTSTRGIDLIIEHPATSGPQDVKGYPAKSKMTVTSVMKDKVYGNQIKEEVKNDFDDLDDLLSDDSLSEVMGDDFVSEEDYEEMDIATFLPFGQMLKVLTATRPTVLFFDDFAMAPPSVQASLMQVIGDRNLCGREIPSCVKIVACTNDKKHKANVKGMLEPIKSRFGSIVELLEDLPGFRNFSIENKLYPSIGFFLECEPNAFCDFRTDKGMEQSPNPRLWEKLSKKLYWHDNAGHTDSVIREINVCSSIGETWGKQFAAFERLRDQIDSYETILADPENYPINQKMDVRFTILSLLAVQGKLHHSDRIFQYTNKMAKDYQVIFFRMLKAHNPKMRNTDEGQRWWADNMDIYLD